MKRTLLTIAILLPLAVLAQIKKQPQGEEITSSFYVNNKGNITFSKPDTSVCYFLKVPSMIEFGSQTIEAKWYIGFSVSEGDSRISKYLYLDKTPVKEQVLISIPKQK